MNQQQDLCPYGFLLDTCFIELLKTILGLNNQKFDLRHCFMFPMYFL